LLVTRDHVLKIADFGLARKLPDPRRSSSRPPLTPGGRVVTLWYRAPELLLGSNTYDEKADIWSAGVVFGELLAGVWWLRARGGCSVAAQCGGAHHRRVCLSVCPSVSAFLLLFSPCLGVLCVCRCPGTPIFPGTVNTTQMDMIFDHCGTPNEHNWPGVERLEGFAMFTMKPKPERLISRLRERFPALN
jgi:serine/threonine protein kinase